MHQTKKGNQWHFGMKAHIGTAPQGVVHTVVGTAANVADVACAHRVLHGEETTGHGDAGYLGVEKRPEVLEQCPKVTWHIAAKRSRVKALPEGPLKALTQEFEKLKAQVRAKVEHPFQVVKSLFGFRKVRYRGLAKNTAQLHTLFALANLVLCKGRLLAGAHA
jgi:IS5 family transposase